MTRKRLIPVAIAGFTALFSGVAPALAQTPPSLGSAQSFAVLGGTSVSANGTGSVVTGDVGVSPGTSITGFPAGATVVPPFSTHSNDGQAIAAQGSTTALYIDLASRGGATPLGAELGGQILIPGVYSFSSTANIASGTVLRLNGAGIYIFKVGSALTANVFSNVVLENGATSCNVFWQITSAATLNGISFPGTVVAQAGVTLGVGATLNGRALTTAAGAVTLAGGNTVGGCSAAGPGCPVITLSPPTLPPGTVGVPYSQTITASGGTAPYTFTITSGTLPAGMTLTAAGVLSGTPTTGGSSTVTIRATDANGCFASIAYTIVISAPSCPAINFTPVTLPNGTLGVPYTQTFTGSGGTAPYTFDLTAGALPAGLSLTTAGLLSGTPTVGGNSSFTVRATDANGCLLARPYAMVISAAPCPAIDFTPATVPNGTVGVPYSQTFTGSGGTAPYIFSVTAGALPAGLALTAGGVLSGTPTTAGNATFTIRATDANGCFLERPYTMAIATAVPTLPQVFVLMLALGLVALGYLRLRQRARSR